MVATFRRAAVVCALLIATVTAVIGQPTTARLVAQRGDELNAAIENREFHIDSAELLGLMHNNQIPVELLDLRDESDYNVFHLVDAQRVTLEQLEGEWADKITPKEIVVVMSNDEKKAEEAWKRLKVRPNTNVYILAGGINRWLDIYQYKTQMWEQFSSPIRPGSNSVSTTRVVCSPDFRTQPMGWDVHNSSSIDRYALSR